MARSTQPSKKTGDGPGLVRLSPARRQYLDLKQKYPDSILLFRMGDFYETFDDDARTTARVLDIALTARDVGNGTRAPLAGIPHHALESYLGRLIGAGHKVAICEQISVPTASKGIVDRAVVRIVTPGTVFEPGLLDQRRNNYLAAAVSDGARAGFAYIDVTTSEFVTCELRHDSLGDEINRLQPAELLCDSLAQEQLGASVRSAAVRTLDMSRIDTEIARKRLLDHFKVDSLEAFGCEDSPLAVLASGAIVDYLYETQLGTVPQVTALRMARPSSALWLDSQAFRDLEVLEPMVKNSSAKSLLSTVDRTRTAMGGRLIRAWLSRPLTDVSSICERQDAVQQLVKLPQSREALQAALSRIPDLERLANRVRTFSAGPRDLTALSAGLKEVVRLNTAAASMPLPGHVQAVRPCPEVTDLIDRAIADDPPISPGEGNSIRPGFDDELDRLRVMTGDARKNIAAIEVEARTSTGIKSLKVGFNKIFGYYIEVSRTNLSRVPTGWERRQTLVNGERYVTPALKEHESKLLTARDQIGDVERGLFRRVCAEVSGYCDRIMSSAATIATLDAIAGLAEVATTGGWTKPVVDEGPVISIKGGRHPAVEAALGPGRFVPNDIELSNEGPQILIVTGPNMSGKSTFIRQVGVLTLLAQAGSFLPAETARIGTVDRIFTRAGLTDDISGGRSTFMTEMIETATVLNQATPRSLAILDEIGRGTSTYDGLAIAQAVAEFIHNSPRIGCKTLFATHYHEMTSLASSLPRTANFRVAVSEEGEEVRFLHRIVPGSADRSYGVHVARLAGMPAEVVARAWRILEELEKGQARNRAVRGRANETLSQLSLFGRNSEVLEALRQMDVDSMTPLDALNTLFQLRQQAMRETGG